MLGRARASVVRIVAPRTLLAAVAVVLVAAAPARAQTVTRTSGLEVWSVSGRIHALEQTLDGYLWIGADSGLVRFDGARFASVAGGKSEDGAVTLSQRPVTLLRAAPDGGLWIGAGGGASEGSTTPAQFIVARSPDGRIKRFVREAVAGEGAAVALERAGNGALLVATPSSVLRADGDRLVPLPLASPLRGIRALAPEPKGALWVGHEGGFGAVGPTAPEATAPAVAVQGRVVASLVDDRGSLWVATDEPRIHLSSPRHRRSWDVGTGLHGRITGMVSDGDGGLWIGTDEGVLRLAQGAITTVGVREGLPDDHVTALLRDREGNLWVGSASGALSRFPARRAITFGMTDGLLGRVVFGLTETPDGYVWATSPGGINRLGLHEFFATRQVDGFPTWCPRAVAPAAEGGVWIGSCDKGLVWWSPDGRSRMHPLPESALSSDDVRGLLLGRDGTLWVGTAEGVLLTFRDGRFSLAHREETCPPLRLSDDKGCAPGIGMIIEARGGGVWLAHYGRGVSLYRGGKIVAHYGTREGLPSDRAAALYEDADGVLWVGTLQGGLARIANGSVQAFPKIGPNVMGIVEDGRKHLWLTSDKGVVAVPKGDLEASLREPSRPIRSMLHNRVDGVIGEEALWGFQSPAIRARDGRLYFPTMDGIVIFGAPEREPPEPAPKVLLEELIFDGQSVDLPSSPTELRIPPGRGDIEIHYTMPHFGAPHRVRFQYRLAGYDELWHDAQERRAAFYTNIPPGSYRFEVRATDVQKRWTPAPARIAFTLEPHFHQTWYFYGLCTLVLGLLGLMAHRIRVLQVRRWYHALLGERTRIARDLHDSLAQGFTGIGYQLSRLTERLEDAPAETRDMLAQANEMVRYCQVEARQAIWNLRSSALEGQSLPDALRDLAAQAKKSAHAEMAIDVDAPLVPLPSDVEEQLLRIAQEATNNAIAHGHARHVVIRVETSDDGLKMEIRDDGSGFDAGKGSPHGHFGLVGMRERAQRVGGTLQIRSAPGAGTSVELKVPKKRLRLESRA